jgi:hypothetical protein
MYKSRNISEVPHSSGFMKGNVKVYLDVLFLMQKLYLSQKSLSISKLAKTSYRFYKDFRLLELKEILEILNITFKNDEVD